MKQLFSKLDQINIYTAVLIVAIALIPSTNELHFKLQVFIPYLASVLIFFMVVDIIELPRFDRNKFSIVSDILHKPAIIIRIILIFCMLFVADFATLMRPKVMVFSIISILLTWIVGYNVLFGKEIEKSPTRIVVWSILLIVVGCFILLSPWISIHFDYDPGIMLVVQVFVIIPFITYKLLRSLQKSIMACIGMGALSMMFFGISMGYLGSYLQSKELSDYGVKTDGHIMSVIEETEKKIIFKVEYEVQGQKHFAEYHDSKRRHQIGDVLPLKYSSRNPHFMKYVEDK